MEKLIFVVLLAFLLSFATAELGAAQEDQETCYPTLIGSSDEFDKWMASLSIMPSQEFVVELYTTRFDPKLFESKSLVALILGNATNRRARAACWLIGEWYSDTPHEDVAADALIGLIQRREVELFVKLEAACALQKMNLSQIQIEKLVSILLSEDGTGVIQRGVLTWKIMSEEEYLQARADDPNYGPHKIVEFKIFENSLTALVALRNTPRDRVLRALTAFFEGRTVDAYFEIRNRNIYYTRDYATFAAVVYLLHGTDKLSHLLEASQDPSPKIRILANLAAQSWSKASLESRAVSKAQAMTFVRSIQTLLRSDELTKDIRASLEEGLAGWRSHSEIEQSANSDFWVSRIADSKLPYPPPVQAQIQGQVSSQAFDGMSDDLPSLAEDVIELRKDPELLRRAFEMESATQRKLWMVEIFGAEFFGLKKDDPRLTAWLWNRVLVEELVRANGAFSDVLPSQGLGDGPPPALPVLPRCSTYDKLRLLDTSAKDTNLYEVYNLLDRKLRSLGYRTSMFYYGEGFAILTRMEKMKEDGQRDASHFFDNETTISWDRISSGLLKAPAGRYRAIFLVVDSSSKLRMLSSQGATDAYLETLLKRGADQVSENSPLSKRMARGFTCYSMVYEFRRERGGVLAQVGPELGTPGLTVEEHLSGGGIQLKEWLDY